MRRSGVQPRRDAKTIRLALPPHAPLRTEATPFRAALLREAELSVDLVPMPSYAALFEAIDRGACDAAWAPPLVALDLERCGSGRAVLSLIRMNRSAYYSVILARAGSKLGGAASLAGCSMGWVAPESAAGYVVPRLHLRSLGLDPTELFGCERFFGSHRRVLEALEIGSVDAIATYAHYDERAGAFAPPLMAERPRVLHAVGPIPSDVIVVREGLVDAVRERFVTTLLGLTDAERASLIPLMNARRFECVRADHLTPLVSLTTRAAEAALQPYGPWTKIRTG